MFSAILDFGNRKIVPTFRNKGNNLVYYSLNSVVRHSQDTAGLAPILTDLKLKRKQSKIVIFDSQNRRKKVGRMSIFEKLE